MDNNQSSINSEKKISIEDVAKRQKKRARKEVESIGNDISKNILEVKDLKLFYDYGKSQALFDINLNIKEKQVTSIIGPSGCGKSSFLRCINRMNDLVDGASVEGQIVFQGTNIYSKKKQKAKQKTKREFDVARKQLEKFKMKDLENEISSSFLALSDNQKLQIEKLTNEAKLQKEEIKKEFKAKLESKKGKLNQMKTSHKNEYLLALGPKYKSAFERFDKKYDTEAYHKIVDLITDVKTLKRDEQLEKRKVLNHLKRKKLEIKHGANNKESNVLNSQVDKNFVSGYDWVYNKYEELRRKVKSWSPDEVRTKIGLVFQKPNPFAKSIYENIAFGLRMHGITNPWIIYQAVESALKDSALWDEVKDRLNDSALSLSGGQQQRLCIARAIALKPKILLMDEPTASLDPIATSKIEELIKKLKKQYTIIIVTHSMQQAARLSDSTAFFYQGYLIEYNKTSLLFKNPSEVKTKEYVSGKFG